MFVIKRARSDGNERKEEVSFDKVLKRITYIAQEANLKKVEPFKVAQYVISNITNNIHTSQLDEFTANYCETMISEEPEYDILATRILVSNHQKNCRNNSFRDTMKKLYNNTDQQNSPKPLVSQELIDIIEKEENWEIISSTIDYKRDNNFDIFGFRTLYHGYLLKLNGKVVERPQDLYMRVALGIFGEKQIKNAMKLYDLVSTKVLSLPTPTLYNGGTPNNQFLSCFLAGIEDSIEGMYSGLKNLAKISKKSGGIGVHVHNLRPDGAIIHSTGFPTTGVIPYLKVLNDMALHVSQGGKRPGSVAVYMEMWHKDIQDFLNIRKNYGDMQKKCHDLFTAAYVSDLFMEYVKEDKDWYLMSSYDCVGLEDTYGEEHKQLYEKYVSEGKYMEVVKSRDLWNSLMTSQIESGTPYISFKDAINKKNNQQNIGTIKSSNLCVHPDTMILIKTGYFPIKELENQKVEVWNGFEFSETIIQKTGQNQKLITVKFDNNIEIKCTPYHKFYIKYDNNRQKEVQAQNLKKDDIIIGYQYPKIDSLQDQMKYPYLHGLNASDISYHKSSIELPNDIEKKFFVPVNYSIETKIEWLAGLFDNSGVIIDQNGVKNIQIVSINKQFLTNIMYLLNTMSLTTNIILNNNQYVLNIDEDSVFKLKNMGLQTDRLNINDIKQSQSQSQHKTNIIIKVKEIVNENEISDTYCFNEPLKHMGIFNGILTGQCNEINQYSDDKEYACCVLSSLPLGKYVDYDNEGKAYYNYEKLGQTARFTVRMLNEVIDKNDYPVFETKISNFKHRPLGIGVQGLQDTFFKFRVPYDSQEAYELNRRIFECIYFNTVSESMIIAKERQEAILSGDVSNITITEFDPINNEQTPGAYSTFQGSPASKGLLQFDLWGQSPPSDSIYNWNQLKQDIQKYGIRNSLLMAIAPTATTSQICGQIEACEPITSNLYIRSVKAGEFTLINKYMVEHLKELDLWNKEMYNKIIVDNGSIQDIEEIPLNVRHIYKTSWDLSQKVIIEQAAQRGIYVCQSQSMNLFLRTPTLKKLNNMYFYAHEHGLKTGIYYLRTRPKQAQTKFGQESSAQKGGLSFFSSQKKVKNDNSKHSQEEINACSRANPEACELCSA